MWPSSYSINVFWFNCLVIDVIPPGADDGEDGGASEI
jgi:hypothetical protein